MVSQSPDGVREVVEYGIWLAGVKSGGIKDPLVPPPTQFSSRSVSVRNVVAIAVRTVMKNAPLFE